MANMIDYMHWRGDLKISQDGLCDVDALILSRLSYLPFEDTVPESFRTGGVSVSRACAFRKRTGS